MKKYRTENLAISSGIAASKKDEWKEESNGPGKNPDNLPRGIDKIKDSIMLKQPPDKHLRRSPSGSFSWSFW